MNTSFEIAEINQNKSTSLTITNVNKKTLKDAATALGKNNSLELLTIYGLEESLVSDLNATLMRLPNLKELEISNSGISNISLRDILSTISNNNHEIIRLRLINNQNITNDSVEFIKKYISNNKLLQLLDLAGTNINNKQKTKINNLLKNNIKDKNYALMSENEYEKNIIYNDNYKNFFSSIKINETEKEKLLQETLTLQPSQAQTIIEFNQLFSMKLEDFEFSAYKNACIKDLDSKKVNGVNNKNIYYKLIDLRPWRWYPQYKSIKVLIADNAQDLAVNGKLLNKIKSCLDKLLLEEENFNVETYKSYLENITTISLKLTDLRNKRVKLMDIRTQLMERRAILLREIKTHGYDIEENLQNVDPRVQAEMFGFHIYEKKAEEVTTVSYDSIPIPFPSDTNFVDEGDELWNTIIETLKTLLKDKRTPPIEPMREIYQIFKNEVSQLVSVESNNILSRECKELEAKKIENITQKSGLENLKRELVSAKEKNLNHLNKNYRSEKFNNLSELNEKKNKLIEDKKNLDNQKLGFENKLKIHIKSPPSIAEFGKKDLRYHAKKKEYDEIFQELTNKINTVNEECKAIQQEHDNIEVVIRLFNRIETIEKEIDQIDNINVQLDQIITYTKTTRFNDERWKFLKKWNDPQQKYIRSLSSAVILPFKDPLAIFWETIEQEFNKSNQAHKPSVFQFNLTPDGFYNQYGQSLQDFMTTTASDKQNTVVMLPYFMKNGGISDEAYQIVCGPKCSYELPSLPIIKFVETHAIKVSWQKYVLGELKHAVNLFPGEKKRIVIEKQTKLTTTMNNSRRMDEDIKRNVTSSFEENLQNEFSTSLNKTDSDEQTRKRDVSRTEATKSGLENIFENSQEATSSRSQGWHAEAEGGFSLGKFGASAKGGKSSTSTQDNRMASIARSNTTRSKEDALTSSLLEEGQQLSKQSRDIASKNVQNTITKVATETSINNKLEITSSSSEQYETSVSNKETMEIENHNVGRTVSYNFFQAQNQYKTSVHLKDVKIVVNTGHELIAETDIKDILVFDINEFNNIYSRKSNPSRGWTVLCSMIAVRVLRLYSQLLNTDSGNSGAIYIDPKYYQYEFIKEDFDKIIDTLNFKNNKVANGIFLDIDETVEKIKTALYKLMNIPFLFREDTVIDEKYFHVNAPAYHLDTQLGLLPATEKYLEQRRLLEIEKQILENMRQNIEIKKLEVETNYIEAKTKAKVFTDLPPNLLTEFKGSFLNTVAKNNNQYSLTSSSEVKTEDHIPAFK